MGSHFTASVPYWDGDSLDTSEPVYDEAEFPSRYEALAWGLSLAGNPSPGLTDFEDHIEVSEVHVDTGIDADGPYPISRVVHRWIYEAGQLVQEIAGDE